MKLLPSRTTVGTLLALAAAALTALILRTPASLVGQAAIVAAGLLLLWLALDFMLNAPRDSVLHGRIDADNIGVVGYSQGGAGAIRAVTEHGNSGAFKTIFTGSAAYAALAKNMGWGYDIAKVTIPYFMTAGTGTSEDAGVKDTSSEFGGVAPLSSLADNYNQMPGGALKVRARVAGAEHWQIQMLTDGYMTAWMRYQLQADPEAASVFIGDKAELLVNRKWQDVEKNR